MNLRDADTGTDPMAAASDRTNAKSERDAEPDFYMAAAAFPRVMVASIMASMLQRCIFLMLCFSYALNQYGIASELAVKFSHCGLGLSPRPQWPYLRPWWVSQSGKQHRTSFFYPP